MGADCVGAIPHFELAREFGEKSIHKTIELAVKYNKLIDVHCDETDDTQSRFLELLNALALMEGIGTRTTASHTCSFGSADNSYVFRMMKLFKKSGMTAYLSKHSFPRKKQQGNTSVHLRGIDFFIVTSLDIDTTFTRCGRRKNVTGNIRLCVVALFVYVFESLTKRLFPASSVKRKRTSIVLRYGKRRPKSTRNADLS